MKEPIIFKNFITESLRKYLQAALLIDLRSNKSSFYDNGFMAVNSHIEEDPFIDALLIHQLEKLKKMTKKNLGPTYGFARQYTKYSTMPEHVDRPSCEYSATLFVGSCGKHKWPIKVNGKDYILEPGSALIYKGCEWKHSRDEFLGDWHLQIFLHWVDMNGPYAEFLFDKRKSLAEKRMRV